MREFETEIHPHPLTKVIHECKIDDTGIRIASDRLCESYEINPAAFPICSDAGAGSTCGERPRERLVRGLPKAVTRNARPNS